MVISVIPDLLLDRYDLLHNAHLKLEGLDELFIVAQVTEKAPLGSYILEGSDLNPFANKIEDVHYFA